MRLTHKTNDNFDRYLPNHSKTRELINNKLGQYEDIEDEFGCDLRILHKAIKFGAWFKNPYYKNQINHFTNLNNVIDLLKKCFDIRMASFVKLYDYSTGGALFYFKDYGKTWALTREELL